MPKKLKPSTKAVTTPELNVPKELLDRKRSIFHSLPRYRVIC